MIYLIAIALMATSAALVWLLNWLMKRGRLRRPRTLLWLFSFSLIPMGAGIVILYLRHLVLGHP